MSENVRSTLLQVTKRKFDNLKAEKHRFDEQYKKALEKAKLQENAVERLKTFIKDIEDMKLVADKSAISRHIYPIHPKFDFMHQTLKQAQYDTAITANIVERWQTQLQQKLDQHSRRHDCALLFNDLVMDCVHSSTNELQEEGNYEKVARKEMHEQRSEWERLAFSQPTIDVQRINAYLEETFKAAGKPEKTGQNSPLQDLRDDMKRLGDHFPRFDKSKVESCIDGVLSADLFTGDKRDSLKDLKKHSNILEEIAHILNQDLDTLETWSWADGHVELDMRRHINGKYRVYMDEELYQAIFLHHIGREWSDQIFDSFTEFREKVWTFQSEFPIDLKSQQRRKKMGCADGRSSDTVSKYRKEIFKNDFWLLALKHQNALGDYEEGSDKGSDGGSNEGPKSKTSFSDLKQRILRLITTEMQLQNEFYGSFTVWQSDFKWFGPSLPHETIFAVLKFLGMDEIWLNFVRKFLTPNLRFKDDKEDAKKRSNGIPIAHQLCTVFGESLMFVLDHAVNQKTTGGNLYRIHDDLWFWGQEGRCKIAWKTLEEFVKIMGLKLNEEKTAATTIAAKATKAPGKNAPNKSSLTLKDVELPKEKVRWGFLVLNSETAHWDIDQEQLEEHLTEFELQLNATNSLMGWIRVWNSYVSSFFTNNFGKPAICLGARHVRLCMEAFHTVQKRLFGNNNLATHVSNRIKSEYKTVGIPDCAVYFPKRLGGLEAHNPLIILASISEEDDAAQEMLKESWNKCENDYARMKKKWDEDQLLKSMNSEEHKPKPFLDWQEYISFLEDTESHFECAYMYLMEDCQATCAVLYGSILNESQFNGLHKFEEAIGCKRKDNKYWDRILALYGEEAVETFGTLSLADPSNLPLGVVDYLFSEKVRWQG
ncbi:uncharacterized protein FA14DRAFT_75468 [Meira miltonrushii]|uniref:Reverse transcriptase domain-containing protein n=1 Tax=Meira miltonrushii TaxID=1280837 RepID=A0A316V4S9_9BASI|nr:uncharacterized protein FA14DRAFT_75468 [Meira miltonrushii]PWN32569.1 hypothetical protein FA14DRAFT_75468 [Meira miltonrushii]